MSISEDLARIESEQGFDASFAEVLKWYESLTENGKAAVQQRFSLPIEIVEQADKAPEKKGFGRTLRVFTRGDKSILEMVLSGVKSEREFASNSEAVEAAIEERKKKAEDYAEKA